MLLVREQKVLLDRTPEKAGGEGPTGMNYDRLWQWKLHSMTRQ